MIASALFRAFLGQQGRLIDHEQPRSPPSSLPFARGRRRFAGLAGKDRVYGASTLGTTLQGMTARFVPESVMASMNHKMAKPGSRGK